MSLVDSYLSEIEKKSVANKGSIEATYYTDLENLIKQIAIDNNLNIDVVAQTSIAKNKKTGIIRPDFAVYKDDFLFGFIEAKDYKKDIGTLKESEQVRKYARALDNILLTNFVDFELLSYGTSFDDGLLSEKASFSKDKDITYNLIKKFLLAEIEPLTNRINLVERLVFVGKNIRDELVKEFKKGSEKYRNLKDHIYNDMDMSNISDEMFCDNYTELVVFSLLFSKIEHPNDDKYKLINLPVLKEWLRLFDGILEENNILKNEYIRLEKIIKNIDDTLLGSFKANKNDDFQDLYTHFYEEFLSQYDPKTRQAYGVYYTDKSISSFINRCIDQILQDKFSLKGLHDDKIELLDFATGSGTFIEEALRVALGNLSSHEKNSLGKDILKRFYGFEIMMSSYILCLFKLNLLLKEEFNIDLSETDSKNFMPAIFLTNTLNPRYGGNKSNYGTELTARNFKIANEIKTTNSLMVIEGNPPYKNGSALNKINNKEYETISQIMEEYKPDGEINIKNLSDDYVRFIAFAQNKIRQNNQGIVGIITNHGFISGVTFRKMRETLLNDFDEIYILDLHGNARTGLADGDKNVFLVQQGVCISFFIKTPQWQKGKKGKIFYADLVGKKDYKFKYLNESSFKHVKWEVVDYAKFDKALSKTKWGKTLNNLYIFKPKNIGKIKEYGEFWGVKEIFSEVNNGLLTAFDDIAIKFNQKDLENNIDDLLNLDIKELENKYGKKEGRDWKYQYAKEDAIKHHDKKPYQKIAYRPFDDRIVWYSGKIKGITSYPRYDIMRHILSINGNIGLCFTRFIASSDQYKHVFITKNIVDCHIISAKDYIAPLYILKPDPLDARIIQTVPNFTADFNKFISTLTFKTTPEEIISYIYAVLNTPIYREEFNELLSTDFPRVFITSHQATFTTFKNIGEALTKTHLLDDEFIRNLAKTTYANDVELLYKNLQNLKSKPIDTATIKKLFSETILNYTIGSYKVVDKYLGYRKNLPLSEEIIAHLVNMLVAISHTLYLQDELDKAWQKREN